MTAGGWFIMITSIACVVALVSFCYYKVLSGPASTDCQEMPRDTDARGPGA